MEVRRAIWLGVICTLLARSGGGQSDDVTTAAVLEDDQFYSDTSDTPTVSDLPEESVELNENACLALPDPGPCSAELVRFFYDREARKCRQFIFGGCQGNQNQFATENECMERCAGTGQPEAEDLSAVVASAMISDVPMPSSVNRGVLTLTNGNGESSFTFSSESPFIQLKAADISQFKLRQMREILFEFRSPEAQGLLVYHTLRHPPAEEPKYELYVLLEGGELKTVHVFGANETTLLVGKGLNRDRWHTASILVNPSTATLQVRVDDEILSMQIEGLDRDFDYEKREHINSTVFIGGMNWVQDEVESSYLFKHFVGCLRNFQLRSGPKLNVIQPLYSSTHRNIVEGCVNKCKSGDNKCRNGGQCINKYDSTICDCFGTKYEGDSCDYDSPTTITLRGYSYISYRIYDWKDRAHTEYNRISMLFRALMGDSILFYAGGTFPHTNHVAVTLLANGSLYVEVDFGSGPHGVHLGEELTMGDWNNFTLIHNGSIVDFLLNGRGPRLHVHSPDHHLRFDPHIFIGGDRKPLGLGLRSSNNFVGCLSEVYFNDVSILYKLRVNSPQALYHSIFRPEIGACVDVPVIPITFPFRESKMTIDFTSIPSADKFNLKFDFKTRNATAVLAHGIGQLANGSLALWELRLKKGTMEFHIFDDVTNETVSYAILKEGQKLADGSWHQVHFIYGTEDVSLSIDYRRPAHTKFIHVGAPSLKMHPSSQVTIGISYFDSMPGFVGCVRDLVINQKKFDPRVLLYTPNVREISLDNCHLVDPCHRPNACEHGGLCMVDEGRVVCDCTGTGYTGKNCHFALYKRTCEELALLGYTKSGVYEIDIDGNGPHPPAHVRCEFEPHLHTGGQRKTVVEHNLPRDVEIRSRNIGDVVFNLTYREFSAEMLQSLVSQSLLCRQSIRYDCYRAPLELHSYTWFRSASGNLLDYLGRAQPGRCPCSTNRTCQQSGVFCNCDADEPRWLSDEGVLSSPEELGITQIYALQQRDLVPQGDGRITLGPLECLEANTQKYVVTFKSPDAYMEVPGWHRGDLAFSFRTSSEKAILLYQPLLHPKHPYFRVLLVNDHQLTLEFSINGEPRSVSVKSSRDLNSGEWQQVWIDYNEYHVRFTVNQESILVDLNEGEEFGPFEATLFIGGAPEEMLGEETVLHSQGLVGCFRGLVMNNEVVNLYAYMNARFPDMIQKHCRPSCEPDPCHNGATCVEFWGSYKCICANPLAHFGYNCEKDINRNALTFRTASSFVEANATSLSMALSSGLRGFFTDDILVNIRTFDESSLIFYAYDYHNNFVQLRLEESSRIVFTFNSDTTIHEVSCVVDDLTTGQSIQILIDREPDTTRLFVNGVNSTIEVPLRLVETYARDPWTNKNRELTKPPRPVRRPEEFYQVFLGGVDTDYMATSLQGFTGCLRGMSVGNKIIDLNTEGADGPAIDVKDSVPSGKVHVTSNWTTKKRILDFKSRGNESGVMHRCNMLCDQQPCQNGGACLEDFRTRSYRCDCELTSYTGPHCSDERGAHFRGDSYITARYASVDLNVVKIKLAFSSTANRNTAQALLLIQTSKDKTKYLLVSLTPQGYLRIEDDRGTGMVYSAEVRTLNFFNGARHSVYYRRSGDSALLLIDREKVSLRTMSASVHSDDLIDVTDENAIHIGGVRSSNDPRFIGYEHFDGCISNLVVELDGAELHPLLAYLGYQRSGLDVVTSHDPEGIEEEARCAAFSINLPGIVEDDMISDNDTSDHDWIPKPPLVLPYKPVFMPPPKYDSTVSHRMLVGLGCLFLALLIALSIYICKTHRRSKKRKYNTDDEQLLIVKTPKPSQNVRSTVPNLNRNRNIGIATSRPVPKSGPEPGLERLLLASPPTGPSGKQMLVDLLDSIESQREPPPPLPVLLPVSSLPPLTPLPNQENRNPPHGTTVLLLDTTPIVDSPIKEEDEAQVCDTEANPVSGNDEIQNEPVDCDSEVNQEEALSNSNDMTDVNSETSTESVGESQVTDSHQTIDDANVMSPEDQLIIENLASEDQNTSGEDSSPPKAILVENPSLSESHNIEEPSDVENASGDSVDIKVNGHAESEPDSSTREEIPHTLTGSIEKLAEELVDHINENAVDGEDDCDYDHLVFRSFSGRAPLGRISEVFLSDDERTRPFSQEINVGDDQISAPSEMNDPPPPATSASPDSQSRINSVSADRAGPVIHRQRCNSDGGLPVPSPVYLADNVRTFANPLSYLGGPRLATINLQRSSKDSVLSIDD